MYIGKLENIIDKFNNVYHKAVKLKPIDAASSTYFEFHVEKIDKDLKFKVAKHVKLSKHKNIFAKVHKPKSSEQVFVIKTNEKYCAKDICSRRP